MKNIALIAILSILLWSCNQNSKTYALIETEFGNMKVELYNSTPKHKENFIKLVEQGFYDNLLSHRVIPGFMIRGGDWTPKWLPAGQPLGQGIYGYTIEAEIGEVHIRGAGGSQAGRPVNPEPVFRLPVLYCCR